MDYSTATAVAAAGSLSCREGKTGSKMPEVNYLLSVSWGYIKVCFVPLAHIAAWDNMTLHCVLVFELL